VKTPPAFADVVEAAPAYDHAQLTAVAASHVVYELLSAMATRRPTPTDKAPTRYRSPEPDRQARHRRHP